MATPSVELEQRLLADRQRIEARMNVLMDAQRGVPTRLDEAMRHALFGGGKRLRPLLVLWTAEALGAGPKARDHALDAGAAIEMLHTYSLIHDDLPAMDDDDLRRGRPTCHVAFDEATAILAGDALQAAAFRTLARVPRCGARLVEILADAVGPAGMVGGQQEDLDSENVPLDARLIRRIHTGKTACLLGASFAAGGVIAGASTAVVQGLERGGRKLGLAFQAADDVLDVVADVQVLGKTPGKDEASAKPTWVRLEGLDKARARARRYGREGAASLRGILDEKRSATPRLLALCERLWRRDR